MFAIHYGHLQFVELLLSKDSNIDIQNKLSLSCENIISAFTIACYEGH